jgi:hypothetical protein
MEVEGGAGYYGGMKPIRYAVYPPPSPGLPWLAVALKGAKPIEIVGSAERRGAERALAQTQARIDAKMAHAGD